MLECTATDTRTEGLDEGSSSTKENASSLDRGATRGNYLNACSGRYEQPLTAQLTLFKLTGLLLLLVLFTLRTTSALPDTLRHNPALPQELIF
eukprot:g65394.t1